MFLKTFEKMRGTLLYWFGGQQQTSTLKQEKNSFFNTKFNAEFNKISFFFLKASKKRRKMAKTKGVQKNTNASFGD